MRPYQRLYTLLTRHKAAERFKKRYYANIELSRKRGREEMRARYLQNPERYRAIARATYYRNLEVSRWRSKMRMRLLRADPKMKKKLNAAVLASRAKKPDKYREIRRRYVERYPERVRLTKNNNEMMRRQAVGKVTKREWNLILDFYGHKCTHCGMSDTVVPLTIDHYIPLSKGGWNTWYNVWPMCDQCNNQKRGKMPKTAYPPHVKAFLKTGEFEIAA